MNNQLVERVLVQIEEAAKGYHRFVVLVAPSGTGKTAVFQEVSDRLRVPVVNLNLVLAKAMLELTERQRVLQLPQLVNEVIEAHRGSVCLLDNIEMLFDPALQHDPLKLLLSLSRNRTVAVAWNGAISEDYLLYAEPGHPEHRRYLVRDFLVVAPVA